MRQEMRETFPASEGWKWSVTTMDSNVGVVFALMQYPDSYSFPPTLILNHHNPGASCEVNDFNSTETDVMVIAGEILMREWNHDFYPQLRIGKWDNPATAIEVKE